MATGFGWNLRDGDWRRARQLFQQVGTLLGPDSTPTFKDVIVNTLALTEPTHTYKFVGSGNVLGILSDTDDQPSIVRLFTKKGDAGDNVGLEIYAKGTYDNITNRSNMVIRYSAAGRYEFKSVKAGTGSTYPFYFISDEVTQLIISSDVYTPLNFRAGSLEFDATSNYIGVTGDSDLLTLAVNQVTVSGATIITGNLTAEANTYFGEYLYHYGDTNTFIKFIDDAITIWAGGIDMIRCTEAGTDSIVFNEGGVDVDIRMEAVGQANALFLQGSNGFIGLGEAAPQDKLEVNGKILVKDKLCFTQDDRNEYIDSLADGYMDYGATTGHRFNANVDVTGTIRTTADQDWNLGAASAQADFAGDTKIRVTIGGTDYDIVAKAV